MTIVIMAARKMMTDSAEDDNDIDSGWARVLAEAPLPPGSIAPGPFVRASPRGPCGIVRGPLEVDLAEVCKI